MKKLMTIVIIFGVVALAASYGYRVYEVKNQVASVLKIYQKTPDFTPPNSLYGYTHIFELVESTYLPLSFFVNPKELKEIMKKNWQSEIKHARNKGDKIYYECMAREAKNVESGEKYASVQKECLSYLSVR